MTTELGPNVISAETHEVAMQALVDGADAVVVDGDQITVVMDVEAATEFVEVEAEA